MDGADASTGPRGKQCLGNHRHVDDDSVSLLHSLLLEQLGHPASIFVGLPQSPLLLLVDHIRHPDECSFVGLGWQVAVKHVVGDIDCAVGEPASEGRVLGQEDGLGELEPADLLRLLLPKLFPEGGGARPAKGFFVRVLIHQIKFIKGGSPPT